MYGTATSSLFLLHRFFGKDGLILFIVLVVVCANIQTLKAIDLVGFQGPVAMGTTLFTTSFLATDIIAEFYGRKEAQKAIWLGFMATLLLSIFMILTIGTKVTGGNTHYLNTHNAIALIFTPTPAIFLASLIAFLISQYADLSLFLWAKRRTEGKYLGLRVILSTVISTLLDNLVFSVLAWRIFYPLPLDLSSFIATYILGTSLLRVLITLINTPLIYLIRRQNRIVPHAAYVS